MNKFKSFNDLSEDERRRVLDLRLRKLTVTFTPVVEPKPELGGKIPPWNVPGSDEIIAARRPLNGRIDEFSIVRSAVPLLEIDKQLREAARLFGDQLGAQINAKLFQGGASDDAATDYATAVTSTAGAEPPNVSFEDMLKIIKEFKRRKVERPFLEAIWFVDAPVEMARFMTAFSFQQANGWPSLLDPYVPIRSWRSDDYSEGDNPTGHEAALRHETARRLNVPFDGLIPGVWLQISDGSVRLVRVDELIKVLKSGENTPD